MAAKHKIVPQIPVTRVTTVNLGKLAGTVQPEAFTDKDVGKVVKLIGADTYGLAAAGDPIEGIIVSVETATSAGYNVGGIKSDEKAFVTADGLQATPGTGVIVVGDYVLTGTVSAVGTALTDYPKVVKATSQTPTPFAWRVVGFYTGTGAVGQTLVIERV